MSRDDSVIAKDSAKVVLIGKDFVLQRQEYARAIDEVNQRQAIVHRDALRSQHFLDGHRKERAGLDRRVIGDEHDLPIRDGADASDDAGRGSAPPIGVHVPGGPQAELKEVVGKLGNAFACGEPAFVVLPLDGLRPAASEDGGFVVV